ncbi:MAG: polysaccharide pyruvyl transferase family protein [Micrococcales bacterium]|nr:polysaccharide pyruvyl transferase family protein [Micrococcales bacterium]
MLTPAGEAALVGVGSLIQQLPDDFAGALWGSGLVQDRRVELPGATALALRGELTRDRMGNPSVVALGDPGLLIRRRIRRQQPRWDVGVVPHYVHREDPGLRKLLHGFPGSTRVVDVQRHPAVVARQIAACRTIVTTSLHGLITADSFGIPAVWLTMPTQLYGGDFKFHDHETVAGPARPRGLRFEAIQGLADAVAAAVPADEERVARACDALVQAARRIPEVTRHEKMSPARVPARVVAAAFPTGDHSPGRQ